MSRPRIAVIATGGTIASQGLGPLDTQDYGSSGLPLLDAAALLARVPALAEVAEVVAVPFSAVPSTGIGWPEWQGLLAAIAATKAAHPDLAGIVVTHGTSTLEETAYFLSLTLPDDLPVVLTGAQRPITALSSDGPLNLVAAARMAADPQARGLGVLVVLNDEVHAAREVTKTSTGRLQAFRSPDLGALGHVDADRIALWRRPVRLLPPGERFRVAGLAVPPRVDVTYSVAGADGVAVRAFLAAGAKGIVAAGFAPGSPAPAERAALVEAMAAGCTVVVSTRVGAGRALVGRNWRAQGFLAADNLTPQKARILLQLALATSCSRETITALFARA